MDTGFSALSRVLWHSTGIAPASLRLVTDQPIDFDVRAIVNYGAATPNRTD
jgi:hypothetical protein